jgi:DNA primase
LGHSIPEDTISRVKNAANIVDVISEHVVLKKAGRNYLGLCPFHVEKTPSFTVSSEKQIFYCFGCHVGGNVFSFVMQKDGLVFPEAVRWLAGKYGIEVPTERLSEVQKARLSENEQLFKINAEALLFFQRMLLDSPQGQKAMSYLLGRGMTRKMIEGHQLGYAPERWDGLLRHFQDKKVSAGWLEKAGLVIARKSESGHYDRFRNRVIFPIVNLNRQVVGFGGRVMGNELPKYLNSPETPVYNKRSCLYGIHKANGPARSTGRIYVVEGYFDVLAMHLYGFDNTVATLGTALTPEHVQLLKGMVGKSGQVYLVFDSDQAGIKAAQRSVAVFEEGLLDAKILILPSGYDPDTFLREHGPDDFRKAADNALGMISFIIEAAINAHGLSLEGKIKVVAEVQGSLAAVQDNLARALYIKQLAERLNIDESAIMEKVRECSGQQSRPRAPKQTTLPNSLVGSDANRLEQQIAAMMLCCPQIIPEIVGRNLIDHFEDLQLKEIAQKIAFRMPSEDVGTAGLISMIEDPGYRSMMARIAIDESHWDRQGCERILAQFEARFRRRDREDLQRRIEEAERNKDLDLLSRLLRLKQQVAGKGLVNL